MNSLIPMLALLTACGGPDAPRLADDSAPLVASCAEGEVLDGDACVPEACGVGTWGTLPVDENTVYVDVTAAVDGDGSESAPLTSIQAGADLAGDRGGGLVAVAAGTYVEVVAMNSGHDGVVLAGRCRDLVTIDGSEGGKSDPALVIDGGRKLPEIGVEGVTVTGGRQTGVWVNSAMVSLHASDFRQNAEIGILVTGGETTLDGVGVYDTEPDRQGNLGRGIDVEGGAALIATGCTIQGSTELGVLAFGAGTSVELSDTQVLDTLPNTENEFGFGIDVEDGATLIATRCRIQGSTCTGIVATNPRTDVQLVETEVLDTLPTPGGLYGFGISAKDRATLTVTDGTVQGNSSAGVLADSGGTTVHLTRTVVSGTLPNPDGTGGRGVNVQGGAALTASDCTIQGNTEVGVLATSEGTSVTLEGCEVLDTLQRSGGTAGHGVEATGGAALTASECVIRGNIDMGLSAADDGTTVDLMDSAVLDTLPSSDGSGGRGINVQSGAIVNVTGSTIESNTEVGVLAGGPGATAALVDTQVLGTLRGRNAASAVGVSAQDRALVSASGGEISREAGPGVYVAPLGQVQLSDVEMVGNAFAGIVVAGGSLEISASTVTGTLPDPEWGGGFGVYASDSFGAGTIRLLDSTIGPHDYAAIWLDGHGSYDIEGNTLSGSVGVNDHGTTIHGNAVFAENGVTAWDEEGETGLLLADNTFSEASEIGVLLHGASATLTGNVWSGNAVDLRQQLCDGPDHVHGDFTSDDGTVTNDDATPLTTDDRAGIPTTVVCPAANVLVSDIVFTTIYLPETETDP